MAEHRQKQLAAVRGRVLEIGIGTGLNLSCYPAHIRQITAIDPNPGVAKLLVRRAKRAGIEIDQRIARGEQLPFEEGSFESVVSTLTLCSIGNAQQALREIYRVLRPDGHFVFFEHGLSPEPMVQKWQRRLNPLQRLVGDGCRLDLDVRRVVTAPPYRSVTMENFYLPGIPRTHGFVYRGVATK
jgi:ubiquinone/menaquinone biosynthesis C-methylase UbiE